MKRMLALLLALTLLAACLILLPACSKIGEKDYEKNPTALLSQALTNAGERFFTGNNPLASVASDAMKNGAISVLFDSEIEGVDMGVSGTIYTDEEKKQAVIDASLHLDGKGAGGRLFLDRQGMILSGADLLGSDTALGIFPATLAANFGTSALADLMCGDNADARAQMKEMMESFADTWHTAFEGQEENYDFFNQLIEHMQVQLATEKIAVEGKKQKCLTVTYTVNNESLKEIVDLLIEEYDEVVESLPDTNGVPGFDEGGLADEWESLYEELNGRYQMSATLKYVINRKDATMVSIYVDASLTPKAEDDTDVLTFTAEAAFGENRIRIGGETNEQGEINGGALVLTKTANRGSVNYVAEIEIREDDQYHVPARLTVDIDGANDSIYAELMLQEGVHDRKQTYRLNGELRLEKTKVTVCFNQLKTLEETYEFELSFSFDALAKMPAPPEAPKDVVQLTEEELVALAEDISNSELGQLINKKK